MKNTERIKRFLFGLGLATIVTLSVYLLVIRPWHLSWGATEEEVRRTMPGDEIVPDPTFNGTRAVTLHARPEAIWPWLVQMGYRKAGFYSYDLLDNDAVPSAEMILPEYQELNVGDPIPMSKNAYVTVIELVPNESMVWKFQTGSWGNSTWAWGLYKMDDERTRLITRLRIQYNWRSPSIFSMLLVDVVELVMMRKCLLGIQRRAESAAAARNP